MKKDQKIQNLLKRYSTKQKFARKTVSNMFHIIDWFPTILRFAGFTRNRLPDNIDGVDQTRVLEERDASPVRKKFIYGFMNEYIEGQGWKTYYAVRWGYFKYFSYQQVLK